MIGRPFDFLVELKRQNEIASGLSRAGIRNHFVYIQDVRSLVQMQFDQMRTRKAAFTVADFDYSVYHTADEVSIAMNGNYRYHEYVLLMQQVRSCIVCFCFCIYWFIRALQLYKCQDNNIEPNY